MMAALTKQVASTSASVTSWNSVWELPGVVTILRQLARVFLAKMTPSFTSTFLSRRDPASITQFLLMTTPSQMRESSMVQLS